ncbi:MAG: penicillin-binding protein activator [bacterium]|nr:penicillin-binding protein activator [bacterium]
MAISVIKIAATLRTRNRVSAHDVLTFLSICTLSLALSACGSSNLNKPLAGSGEITQNSEIENPGTIEQAQTRIADTSAQRIRQQKGIKVALLLPLGNKGNTAKIATALKQAGQLAMFDFNNPDIILTTKDTKGTPAGAKAAASEAIKSGVELIIGPLFAKNVKAAAPIAQKAGVPMIALSSDRKVAGNGVYLLSFLAGQDVDRIVSYAVSHGKSRFAALIPDTPYGHLVESAFQSAVQKHGARLVAIKRFPVDPNGMLGPIEEISKLARTKDEETKEPIEPQIDALFIPSGPDIIPTLSPILPYFEVDTTAVKLIGTGSWDYSDIGREKPLRKAWFPGPDPKGWRKFTQRYAATFGTAPPRIASLAYDAVSLAVSLSKQPHGSRFTNRQLTRNSGFAGVDGLFRLRSDGTSERGLAVLEIQKFGPRVIDGAPSIFSRTASSSSNLRRKGFNPF